MAYDLLAYTIHNWWLVRCVLLHVRSSEARRLALMCIGLTTVHTGTSQESWMPVRSMLVPKIAHQRWPGSDHCMQRASACNEHIDR